MASKKSSRRTKPGQKPFPPFKSGTLTRRFHAEPMSEALRDAYANRILTERVRIARTTGLSPAANTKLVRDLVEHWQQFHTSPYDSHGKPLLQNVNGELGIVGGKIIEESKRKRNIQPMLNRLKILKDSRAELRRLQETYPGIDMNLPKYRELSPRDRDALTFFKLSVAKQTSMRKKYFELTRIIFENRNEINRWRRSNPKW